MPKRTIIEVAYHRNGISGNGFHVVRFDDQECGRMVATVFDEPGQIAVLNVDQTSVDNIAFAQGNSWRGDDFESDMRRAIDEYGQSRALITAYV